MNESGSDATDSTAPPDPVDLLARYQQAWADGDIDAIVSMTPEDGVYEASFGPEVWGERFVGPEAIRAKLVAMGVDQPGRARHASTGRRTSSATAASRCGRACRTVRAGRR